METKEEKPEAVLKNEVSTETIVNVEADACKVVAEFSPEVEAMEVDIKRDKSEASFSEQKKTKTGIIEGERVESSETSDESGRDTVDVLNAVETVTKEFHSAIGHPDNTTPVKVTAQIEISEQIAARELDGGNDGADPGSSEEMNAEMENCEEREIGEVNAEIDRVNETEDGDLTTKASKSVEAETNRMNVEIDKFVPDTLEMNTEGGNVISNKTETNIILHNLEETKLDDNQVKVEWHLREHGGRGFRDWCFL